jgi:hypothetical protein
MPAYLLAVLSNRETKPFILISLPKNKKSPGTKNIGVS